MLNKKKTLWNRLGPLSEKCSYPIITGFTRGLIVKGGLSFLTQLYPLTKEQLFLSSLDLTGKTVYDIGGCVGFLTGFFSLKVGESGSVVTFEPNPHNFKKIQTLIRLNNLTNVKLLCRAAGQEKGTVDLCFDLSSPAEGTIDASLKNNLGCLKAVKTVKVEIDTIDNQIFEKGLPIPDFIKIDVEGFEVPVLYGMANLIKTHKPRFFIEIHGANMTKKLANAKGVVNFLSQSGYNFYHVESKKRITINNSSIAAQGHLFAWSNN